MSTTILLIRHGETAWNREKIFRGVYDIPLNENGRDQARQVARALKGREIHAAYSSPLSRAIETAQIALKFHGIKVKSHPSLIDFNYGEWTGLADGVVAEKWPQAHALWIAAPWQAHPPSGDSLSQVFERAFGTLAELIQKHPGQTIAIFAHRVVNKLLVLGMLTLGLERFPFIRQDNCCLNEFLYTGSDYIAIALNNVNHIKRGGAALLKEDF